MNIDIKTISAHSGRWLILVAAAIAAWLLMESAVHPMMQAAPLAKTLSALIGYGLVVTLVCFMRWSPLQPLLAPLFDEVTLMARIASGKESAEPQVRSAAMIACGVYGGLTFAAVVIAGAMLAGVAH